MNFVVFCGILRALLGTATAYPSLDIADATEDQRSKEQTKSIERHPGAAISKLIDLQNYLEHVRTIIVLVDWPSLNLNA